jgi:7-keto-8-aminopelargonate synthetase-like enzyme
MNFDKMFQAQLDSLKEEGNYRVFAELQRECGSFPRVKNHNGTQDKVTVWCSNDYLGMGHHPDVIGAMVETTQSCGAGAGGTRNISGNAYHHKRLEDELADLHNKEAALLFTSGYVSNWAALSTLGARLPSAVILSDALNHASMIEGIRHARCQKVIWEHNNPEDLDRKLAALPPSVAAAATASIRHLKQSSVERDMQKRQVARLRARLDAEGIPHVRNPSHIIPVMVKDPVKCKMLSDILMEQFGIYVQPINYPTVPKGTERLRFTPGPLHTDEDIEYLVMALSTLWKQCAIAHAVA